MKLASCYVYVPYHRDCITIEYAEKKSPSRVILAAQNGFISPIGNCTQVGAKLCLVQQSAMFVFCTLNEYFHLSQGDAISKLWSEPGFASVAIDREQVADRQANEGNVNRK